MKKHITALILTAALCGLLAACGSSPDSTGDGTAPPSGTNAADGTSTTTSPSDTTSDRSSGSPAPFVAGEPGNSASNMSQSRIHVSIQGDWIYILANDELLKMSADGSQTTKMEYAEADTLGRPLFVTGDYIYARAYRSGVNAFIAQIKTDGTDFVNITAENGVSLPEYYRMEGDWIYYRSEGYVEGGDVGYPVNSIWRKNVDGTQDVELTRYDADMKERVSISHIFLLDGDYVYYYKYLYEQYDPERAAEDEWYMPATLFSGICRIRKDGTGEEEVVREALEQDRPTQFIVDGDWLYYQNGYDGNLVKVHMESRERIVLLDRCNEFLLSGDKIIYTLWNEDAAAIFLHAVNLDGSGDPLLLVEGIGNNINIAGDWVFFYDYEGALYRIRTDGSGEAVVE